MGVSSAMHRA